MGKTVTARVIDGINPRLGRFLRQWRDERTITRPIKTRYGFSLSGPPVLFRENWEFDELSLFEKLLSDTDVCVDIGANAGYYTCLGASRGKHVLAVEPMAGNLKFLYNNLRINDLTDNVEVYPLGFSTTPSLLRIYGRSDVASFVKGWQQQDGHYDLVPTVDMDLVVGNRFSGKKLLIKLDVEGYELNVLRGAQVTLALQPRPTWIVEAFVTAPETTMSLADNFRTIFETFWSLGYKSQSIGSSLVDVTPKDVDAWVKKGEADGPSNYLFSAV